MAGNSELRGPLPRNRFFPPEGVPLPVALGLAALGYPFFWVPIIGLYIGYDSGFSAGMLLLVLGICLIVAFFVGLGSGWLAMAIGFILWHVTQLGMRSLRVRLGRDQLAASVGAWTVLTICLVLVLAGGDFFIQWDQHPRDFQVLVLLLGPGIGTIVAQYIGAWSQWSMGRVRRVRGARQFGIFQLLVATAWIAVALAGLKLAGLLETRPLVYLGGWLVWQTASLPVVLHVCRRRNERWWRERKRRERDDGGMRG